MRTSNKKNKKIIKIIIFSFALILSYFLVIRSIHLKEGKDLFIDALSILSMIHNNRTEIIYDYIKNRDKVYVYDDSLSDKTKRYIKSYFPSVKYVGDIRFVIYSHFFKDRIIFYSCDNSTIDKLKSLNVQLCRVVLSIYDITEDEYLTLKETDNTKLFLSFTNREIYHIDSNYSESLSKYVIGIDKNAIRVVDGDTIRYNKNYYRFIGLDAPELKQEYGTNVMAYVREKISNATNVNILIGSYDAFGRILCHLFIDDIPLAYPMMQDKQAKETIMKYGDNGFVTIASNIVYLSKFQGRRPFKDPAQFRRENR